MRRAYKAVKERDGGCSVLSGRAADDICHIVPRRFKSLMADVRNLVCLTRREHVAHETEEGRRKLLQLLKRRHGYEYPEEVFQRYLR